ncbi:MAG: hypothetical protein LKE64_02785 [Solobacterium sp.]|jgi:hypothetical protein|nr:hypothetical protein [Solobacterium sp.]MCH4049632.1 hypothetical protein [Solobacterium sp.]MCH4073317.1 hypothetical protein [Solobacterium sp.]MCI1313127.1 hypothetical protein [Solobacterium sp.]MCI1345443.1 hypothetical protein [Solobacterium sp.]
MSILETDNMDGIAVSPDGKKISLLIMDPLEWNALSKIKEKDHLELLMKKLNVYAYFLDHKQYQNKYPNADHEEAEIEIHFRYKPSDKCLAMLNGVGKKLAEKRTWLKVVVG